MLRRCALLVINPDLKSTCCSVSSLSTMVLYTADELSLLSDAVCSCKQLVDLCCLQLDFAARKHLSNIPTLLTVIIEECEIHSPHRMGNFAFYAILQPVALTFDVGTSADVTK
jgi:hypothetical protein